MTADSGSRHSPGTAASHAFLLAHLCQMHYAPIDPLWLWREHHTSHWTLAIPSANFLKALGCKVTQSADLNHHLRDSSYWWTGKSILLSN